MSDTETRLRDALVRENVLHIEIRSTCEACTEHDHQATAYSDSHCCVEIRRAHRQLRTELVSTIEDYRRARLEVLDLREENRHLREALKNWGKHHILCSAYPFRALEKPCNCGLSAALGEQPE